MALNHKILDSLTCRQVLNIMVILGFMLNYMLRVNMTIAIVSMVIPSNDTWRLNDSSKSATTENFDRGIAVNVTSLDNGTATIAPNPATASFPYAPAHEETNRTRYPWNEYQVNLVLGSFFWGYICTELPGGRLAEVVGPKRVFGYSMMVSSAVTLLTPLSATYGYIAVVVLRAVLGFMLGATWPAMQPMTARWIPPTERSKFVSNMMASSLGAAITMPICGFLIAYLGWESVFYVTGAIGLVWSVAWFFLIFDSPRQHPRITIEERQYIEDSIGSTSTTKRLPVPWKSIFLSTPVWAIVLTHSCNVFGYFTVVNQLPTYMKYILNFNIKENGLLSSLPYLGKYIFAVTTSSVADYLFKTKKLSVTAIRKIFTSFAVLSPGLLMIVQANYGYDRITSVSIFTIALTINGAVTAGYLGNSLDIAPNFSGTIFGMMNTLGSLGGFLSSYMVGSLTYKNQTYSGWSIVFWILGWIYCLGALTFAIFGSGQLQSWNNPEKKQVRKQSNVITIDHPQEIVSLDEKTVHISFHSCDDKDDCLRAFPCSFDRCVFPRCRLPKTYEANRRTNSVRRRMPSITWARRDTKTKMRAKARQLRGQNVNNDSAGRRPYLEYRCHPIQFLYHLGHRTVVRLYRHYYLKRSNDTCVVGDGLRLSEIPNREYDFSRSMILDVSRCFLMLPVMDTIVAIP